MNDRDELLNMIRKYDFMLYDLTLYLDSHPSCPHGLAAFQKYRQLRETAAHTYTCQYGPLSPQDVTSDSTWTWVCSPWPWEKEEN